MLSHFHEKRFPKIGRDISPLSLFKTMKVLIFSLIVFRLFISSGFFSRIFLSCMYSEMRTIFGCSQSNCPWHSFVCSIAPDDFHFPLMLSFFLTHQYISHCMSNLTDIFAVDYLVVVLVCFFHGEFAVDFFLT